MIQLPPAVLDATHVTVQVNARLQPVHRGEHFEDPLDEALRSAGLGEVDGGGSLQSTTGEIEFCDIEVAICGNAQAAITLILEISDGLGIPKGSKLHIEPNDQEIPFGVTEGLAVYLNGTDLPSDVYETCDSNHVLDECNRLLGESGRVLSWWQGPTETAFYMYGTSFDDMSARIAPFLARYPLCQSCRVVRIA